MVHRTEVSKIYFQLRFLGKCLEKLPSRVIGMVFRWNPIRLLEEGRSVFVDNADRDFLKPCIEYKEIANKARYNILYTHKYVCNIFTLALFEYLALFGTSEINEYFFFLLVHK